MGFSSWLATGLGVVALVWLFAGAARRRRTWRAQLVLGMTGAVVGGVLATVFGFGGLLALDPRALVSAGLGALAGCLACTIVSP